MKYSLLAATMLAACALSSAAHAQDVQPTGFYGGLNAGLAKVGDADISYYDGSDSLNGEFDFKDAATFGGVLGYDFGPVRTDLEVSYARNKVRAFTVNDVNGQAVTFDAADRAAVCDYLEADGCGGSGNTFEFDGVRLRQLNAMANLWADLPIGPIVPYVGGGIGVSGFEVDGEGKAKFAWQVGGGAAFQLSPALALTADYRHREVKRTTVDWEDGGGFRLGKLKTDTFTAGLRFYFGGPSAAPVQEYVAPPAPAPVYEPAPAPAPAPVEVPRAGERG